MYVKVFLHEKEPVKFKESFVMEGALKFKTLYILTEKAYNKMLGFKGSVFDTSLHVHN